MAAARTPTSRPGRTGIRVVGPIFVYFNAVDNPRDPTQADLDRFTASFGSGIPAVPKVWHDNALALWNDAVAKSKTVKAAWPYDRVQGVDYPHKAERGTVTGQLVLDDPQAASKSLPNLTVGLTHVNYQGAGSGYQLRAGNGNIVTWPHDGDYYEFWVNGSADGRFTIPNVRPGTYVLRAFANGVLGEDDRTAKVTVEAGKTVNLGKLDWQPVRYGKQVWESATPTALPTNSSRATAPTTGYGDGRCAMPALPQRHHLDHRQERLPQGLVLRGGAALRDHSLAESRLQGPVQPTLRLGGNSTHQRGPVRVGPRPGHHLDCEVQHGQGIQGTAVLRIALAGDDGTTLAIGINGQTVGTIRPVATNALRYNTNKGVWNQYIVKFDASLMKAGANEMTFTVPAGDVTTGVVWDYLRLELNDGSKAYPTPPNTDRPDYPTLE